MHPNRYIAIFALIFVFFHATFPSYSQLGLSFDIKKPKQYEERVLRSEKSDQKKFTLPRRFIQNLTTHYNYFFNANNKLNEIISRAKSSHKDDYTKLLSFYNYDLNVTTRDSLQLDSVIYKATTGIVLHDLRNDWVDNLYLLWGAAYYLKKQFDSAYLTFQFINYAFADKEKDGYYKFIGSSRDGNSALSISTKEKRNLPQKIFSLPPSRNDAFVWQIRTFLAQDQFPEAASLIVTLKNDPVFPKRLQNDLEEVEALYFYKQNAWDSAAFHLSNALGNTTSEQEKARWEFLTAQMYELSGKYSLAQSFYEKATGHTSDPVMEVYSRLNSIKVNKTGGENYIEKNIDDLLRMAKRDKYNDYRSIIYYMAAQMELERNNIGQAQQLLLKSTQYNGGDSSQRNLAYLKLAELAFANKDYRQAYNFYDSIRINDPALKDTATISQRKEILGSIALQTEIIARQDSLQKIAALPEEQRKEFVKKLVKELLKQQGVNAQDNRLTTGNVFNQPFDIFSASQSSKGEWYFYNTALRSKGSSDFKARWGNRPNVDNWRRSSAVAIQIQEQKNPNKIDNTKTAQNNKGVEQPVEISYESLYAKLPLTKEKLEISNDSVKDALFNLGKIYASELEDCSSAIMTLENLRNRFPDFYKMDEVLFNLYYCYKKNGDPERYAQIKKLMNDKYKWSNFTTIITTGKNPSISEKNSDATKTYEKIYDLFIEGKFDEAQQQKKSADSLYGENFWSPQLLYIEAVYYVKQRKDSIAIISLQKIKLKYPNSPLAAKATTLIDVLGRRNQIEEELRNLQIERPKQEIKKTDTVVSKPVVKTDSAIVKKVDQPKTDIKKVNQTDTIARKKSIFVPFVFNASVPHYAMIILNKVDIVFGNEAKNAFFRYNQEKFYNKTYEVSEIDLDAENKLILIKPFANSQAAIDYVLKAKPLAASEIIPWLKSDRYSFSIISEQNLDILKSNPDLASYKRFLDQNLPGKF